MTKEPTVDFFLNRFSQQLQSALYPFLVLSIIERNESATRQKIKDEISRLSRGTIEYKVAAHHRLIGRMDKSFRLIERLGNQKDADLVQYRLTIKGKRLYSESLNRVIFPLGEILPTE